MTDRDSPDQAATAAGDQSYQPNHLPVPVPRPSEMARANGESWIGRTLRTLFGWKSGSIRADLKDVLEADSGETGFSPVESRMLRNILSLRERRIGDVRIPRADIVAVQQDIQLGELLRVFETAEHSRLVVYNDTLDDPVGMVHIRDLIAFMAARATASAQKNVKRKKLFPAGLDLKAVDLTLPLASAKIIREILFVPPSMRALDLLTRMQATRIQLALVIDEYGGSEGLISIEDVVEEIVGDIADEHDDDDEPDVHKQADGSFIADARVSLDDVVRIIGPDFDPGETGEEVDTVGGYLTSRAGRVPLRGEIVPGPGRFEIEVLDADPRRVKRIQIHPVNLRRERKRREPDAVLAGTAPPPPPYEEAAQQQSPKPAKKPRP